MAQWILVFAPDEVNLNVLADRLPADARVCRITDEDDEDDDEMSLDVVRSMEHVEIFLEDTTETLLEHEVAGYDPQETAWIVSRSPNLTVLRITYYRGTDLLHSVLCVLHSIMEDCLVDNDYGVIERLGTILEQSLSTFLASRKPLVK